MLFLLKKKTVLDPLNFNFIALQNIRQKTQFRKNRYLSQNCETKLIADCWSKVQSFSSIEVRVFCSFFTNVLQFFWYKFILFNILI